MPERRCFACGKLLLKEAHTGLCQLEQFIQATEVKDASELRRIVGVVGSEAVQQAKISKRVETSERMFEMASEPCQKGYVPVSIKTLREWARVMRE